MKGDFTRNTFKPTNHFSRVLMQQGRVQLDADWNELNAVLLHYMRSLAADLIGPHGGPNGSFEIAPRKDDAGELIPRDFVISSGHYYVDGILCENDQVLPYTDQPDYPLREKDQLKPNLDYLVYLDVFEQHITYIQDDGIREVALGDPDTATRAKVVWQVKVYDGQSSCPSSDDEWNKLVENWQSTNRGKLKAGVKEFDAESAEPCNISPESKYRGEENQLYRVEIHRRGEAWDGKSDTKVAATFKWSRENGSVIFPISNVIEDSGSETTMVVLENLGRDDRFSLQEGDMVEIVDDVITLQGKAETLMKVIYVDQIENRVRLEGLLSSTTGRDLSLHPLLRRWDHKELDPTQGYPPIAGDGALVLEKDNWLLLEEGIQIYFESAPEDDHHTYRTGDYWLIPARTATGDVEWPGPEDNPESLPPQGVDHHFAPLAIISVGADGSISVEDIEDCRCKFQPMCAQDEG